MASGKERKVMAGAAELAQRLNARPSGDGYIAHCPVPGHGQGRGDRSPSLSISEGADGKVLWKCHAGCSQEAVGAELGLNKSTKKTRPEIVATFTYRDEDNKPLYTKRRYEPGLNGGLKSFLFEHGNGQKGRGGEAVLYNAPALTGADTVYIVEGEAKADLLSFWGLTSSCLDSGAGSPFRPEYAEILAGKHIVILTDNDKPGRNYAEKIAANMKGTARSIKIIDLSGLPEAGDIVDWARQEGNNKTKLLELIAESPVCNPGEATVWDPGEITALALKNVSLANLEYALLAPPKYAVDQLIPLNEVTLFGGHGGSGKSQFALLLAAIYACFFSWFGFRTQGGRVVYISLEDPAEVMIYRLKKICEVYDLPYELVIKNLTILEGSSIDGMMAVETSEYGVRDIQMTSLFEEIKVACVGAGLVIIDNASDAFGGNEISRTQVRKFIRCLRNDIARPNNAGVVLLAHIDKAGARGGTNENTYSGSTAWHNSVRSRLALTAKKDGTVELVQEKLNLGKKLDRPIPLTWVDGVLMPDSNIAEGLVSGAQEDLDKGAVLTAIKKAVGDGESIPTARTGPKTTQGVLERYPDLPSHLKGRKGRDTFYRALTDLQRDGILQIEEYTTADRNIRQRFRVCVSSDVQGYTPNTLHVELTKLTQGVSLVTGIALKAGTNETNETNAGEDLIL